MEGGDFKNHEIRPFFEKNTVFSLQRKLCSPNWNLQFESFPRTRTVGCGIRFLKSLKGWNLWESSGYSSYKSSQVISLYEHCTKMFDSPISDHNFRFKISKWAWNDIQWKETSFGNILFDANVSFEQRLWFCIPCFCFRRNRYNLI